MHLRKSKKVLIYFSLLIFIGSINNINLSNFKLKEIENIKVIGLEDKENIILEEKIQNLKLGNIFFLRSTDIKNQINSNTFIEKYNIFKIYPASLDIHVKKTELLAKINKDRKIFFIGSNGKLSEKNFSKKKLPFIFGKPQIEEFLNFKKIIDESNLPYDQIKNLYFFQSKRWDIELKNNIVIKLSRKYPKDSLSLAIEFLYKNDSRNTKIIDARIKNQIIIND